MNKSNHNNAKITDKTSFLRLENVTSNGNQSQLLAVSKVNNSNAKNTYKTAFLHVKSGNPDNM